MIAALASRLRLEPEELRQAFIDGGMLFAFTASYTLVRTARDAYFLAELPVTTLPWVYLAVGLLAFVIAGAFERATHRFATCKTLGVLSLGSAVVLLAFAWLMGRGVSWGPIALYLWVNVYGLLLMVQFWVFVNSGSDPREAKRILGIVGGGGIVGGLVGGALAAPLAAFGLPMLLVVGAALLLAVPPQVYRGSRQGHLPATEPEVEDPEEETVPPVRHPYVRWLALASLCSVVVTGLLDYQFKVALQQRIPEPERLATFIGQFYIAINLASLIVQLFATRWALQRFGAGWSAAVLPAGITVGALATVALPGLIPVVATRLWDQMERQSLNRSAIELFYFPLSPGLRRRVKSAIGAGLERLGDALAGGLLIAIAAFAGSGVRTLAIAVLALLAVWAVAWLGVRRGYVFQLARNLRRMNLHHEREMISLREASLLVEMKRLLEHPFERLVLHGLELIEESAPETLPEHLPALLEHASPRVRARAVALAGKWGGEAFRPALAARLEDEDPDVRLAALRASHARGELDPLEAVRGFLESDDPRHRRAALLYAAENAGPVDDARLLALCERRLRDGTVEDHAAVAEALGRRPAGTMLHALLDRLLRHPQRAVRVAAYGSAGRLRRRADVPILIEALTRSGEREAARAALVAYADGVSGTLSDWLSDRSVPSPVRRELPRVLGEIGTQEAANGLMRCREREDVRLAYRILKACNRIRAADKRVRFDAALAGEDLELDARAYGFALVHSRACPEQMAPRSPERLLLTVLGERMDQALDRVFRRLALLYPPRTLYDAWRGLSGDRRQRGNAIEYLENALAPAHRALVLPLVNAGSDEERLRFVEQRWGFRPLAYDDSLEQILGSEDVWLRAVALQVIGTRRDRRMLTQVEANLGASNALVREIAAWAVAAIALG